MFLYLNRSEAQDILVTATEGRGTLDDAIITIQHLQSNQTITLEKANSSTNRDRYDRFEITPEDIDDMPDGDFLYTVKAAAGGDIDPDDTLETGRGRTTTTFTETITVRERTTTESVYERT